MLAWSVWAGRGNGAGGLPFDISDFTDWIDLFDFTESLETDSVGLLVSLCLDLFEFPLTGSAENVFELFSPAKIKTFNIYEIVLRIDIFVKITHTLKSPYYGKYLLRFR